MASLRGIPVFGEKIKQLRSSLFLTQEEFATKAGITKSRLSAIEGSKRAVGMQAKKFRGMAAAAGLSPEALLEKIGAEAEATFTDAFDHQQDPREATRKRLSERARQEALKRSPEPTKEPK